MLPYNLFTEPPRGTKHTAEGLWKLLQKEFVVFRVVPNGSQNNKCFTSQHTSLLVQNCARSTATKTMVLTCGAESAGGKVGRRRERQELCKQSDYIVYSERTLIWVEYDSRNTLEVWCCRAELVLGSVPWEKIDELGAVLWNVWLSASPRLWFSKFNAKTRTTEFWLSKGKLQRSSQVKFQVDYTFHMMTIKDLLYTSDCRFKPKCWR